MALVMESPKLSIFLSGISGCGNLHQCAGDTDNRAEQPNEWRGGADRSEESEASAKVVLSDAASALLSATPSAKADFDAEKVERIGKAIADGTYVVNHGAVADKLIANAKELLNKYSH